MNSELIDGLFDALNNKKKKGNTVAYLLSDENAPTNISGWVSTGSSMLDLAISNRPYGGIPYGKLIEFTGLEQSGKSLVAAHALAETQKQGGIAILIDTESAVMNEFVEAIGVDISKLIYVQTEVLEEVFDAIETIVDKVRSSSKGKSEKEKPPVTIVVDSVAAATTLSERNSDYQKEGWATDKAIIISKALRKLTNLIARERITLIFTNQLRMKLGVQFGDQYTTSGGKALGFHASIRVRLKQIATLSQKVNGVDRKIGITVKAVIVKNRIGPPLRTCTFDIYFDRGINDYASWLSTLKEYNLVEQKGAWSYYVWVDEETGEEKTWKFQTASFIEGLENDSKLRDNVYKTICDSIITSYKRGIGLAEDVEIEEPDEL